MDETVKKPSAEEALRDSAEHSVPGMAEAPSRVE